MLTDTHCHVFSESYENIDQVLDEALKNNVNRIINNATDLNSCKEALSLSQKYSSMYVALGIHPEAVDDYKEEDLQFLERALTNDKVVAIGEIGLDYYYTKENKDKQIRLLEYQLTLASKYNLPVIIHNREATLDLLNVLKKYKLKGIIHCFNGSKQIALEFIKLGYKLGVNGVVTFKNCKLKDTLKEIGLENIVLETDAPYLTPVPYRGMKNEPKYLKNIALFIADLFEVEESQVVKITNRNIRQIFDI